MYRTNEVAHRGSMLDLLWVFLCLNERKFKYE